MHKTLLAIILALAVSACSTIVVQPQEYRPPSYAQVQQHPARVALALPAGFAEHRHVGSPEGLSGSLRTFEFHLGRPMTEALRTQLGTSFTLAPEGTPTDILIRPAFDGFRFAIDDDGQALKGGLFGPILGGAASAPVALTELGFRLEALDADGNLLAAIRVTGRGASRGASALSFSMEREFTTSTSVAITDAASRAIADLVRQTTLQERLKQIKKANGA